MTVKSVLKSNGFQLATQAAGVVNAAALVIGAAFSVYDAIDGIRTRRRQKAPAAAK